MAQHEKMAWMLRAFVSSAPAYRVELTMRRLNRFVWLPAAERLLLMWAIVLLGSIRLGMRLLPWRTLHRLLVRIPRGGTAGTSCNLSAERIAWAVTVASQVVPGARTCLIRALAVQTLLARAGLPARCHIGVAKGEGGRLEAHAWVASQDRIVIGGGGLARYTPLVAFEGERS